MMSEAKRICKSDRGYSQSGLGSFNTGADYRYSTAKAVSSAQSVQWRARYRRLELRLIARIHGQGNLLRSLPLLLLPGTCHRNSESRALRCLLSVLGTQR